MPKPRNQFGEKNLAGKRIKALRRAARLSQRDLASRLQLMGMDMDKNVITRIETCSRYVSDFELQAFVKLFDVSYEFLIDGKENHKKGLP